MPALAGCIVDAASLGVSPVVVVVVVVVVSAQRGRELACARFTQPPKPLPVTARVNLQYRCRPPGPVGSAPAGSECSIATQAHRALAQGFPAARAAGLRWLACLALACVGLGPKLAAAACGDSSDEPRLAAVAAGVWRVPAARGEADAVNRGVTIQLVLVRDGKRLWLVGSGPTPAFGAALACAIERETGRRVTDVVNTRATPELALANIAFATARLWALADVIATMRARCASCQARLKARIGEAGASLEAGTIRAPTRPVGAASQRRGRLGPFDWLALPRRAGERTLVLRHRASQVVVAQGLVWAGDLPDLRETESETMQASLRRLRAFTASAVLLGEQGEPAPGAAAIDTQLAYLEALRRAIAPQLEHGDAAAARADLPAFTGLPGYAATHPLNVQRVWRELEPGLFR
jgi:hypothetical protein